MSPEVACLLEHSGRPDADDRSANAIRALIKAACLPSSLSNYTMEQRVELTEAVQTIWLYATLTPCTDSVLQELGLMMKRKPLVRRNA